MNRDAPTFGFTLIEYDGKHYAHDVLEGGPAAQAGLLRGDRIVSIDGAETGESPRLDWRTDDAFLPDPPMRFCLGGCPSNEKRIHERVLSCSKTRYLMPKVPSQCRPSNENCITRTGS